MSKEAAAPSHKAMINVRAEIQEVMPDGRLTNLPLLRPKSKLISIDGDSLDECEQKVEAFLKGLVNG